MRLTAVPVLSNKSLASVLMNSQRLPKSLILPAGYERLFSEFVSPVLWGPAGVQTAAKIGATAATAYHWGGEGEVGDE